MDKYFVRWIVKGELLEHVFLGIGARKTAMDFYDSLTGFTRELTKNPNSFISRDTTVDKFGLAC